MYEMKAKARFELLDWLSTIAFCIFVLIRVIDFSPVLFIVGSALCIIEGVIDLYLHIRESKGKRQIFRLLYSAFIIIASIQGIHLLIVKAG